MPKLKPNQFTLSGHLITERPILFQAEMVQANLEDRKTQTRREVKLDTGQLIADSVERLSSTYFFFKRDGKPVAGRNCKHGKPGDLLWVRETWGYTAIDNEDISDSVMYKADFEDPESAKSGLSSERWKPSIHMPKSASRLWLMVEDIRVERVQDINENDAKAEGIEPVLNGYKNYIKSLPLYWQNPKPSYNSFASLWRYINGEDSWEANPWVWVIQYRILSKTGRPSDDTILENYLQITRKEVSHG